MNGSHQTHRATTLVELMVATAILVVILLLIFSITQQTGDAWKRSAAKIESFQSARAAFESMTRKISQATLNTYYDYYDAAGNRRTASNAATFTPAKYGRYSDLHFICGKELLKNAGGSSGTDGTKNPVSHSIFFQAPLAYSDDAQYKGMRSSLNAEGYFVEYAPDQFRPSFLDDVGTNSPVKNRYRLMQFSQPCQQLSVYDPAATDQRKWFVGPMSRSTDPYVTDSRPAWPIADNIIALVIRPKRAQSASSGGNADLTTDYEYDSRETTIWSGGGRQPVTMNQLPPLVEVIIVAVDEPSVIRLGESSTPPDFGTLASAPKFFKDASESALESDLSDLEDVLRGTPGNVMNNTVPMRYQVFRSEVPIRSSKWSD